MTEKTIIILGAPRGGTSLVAGMARELGVDLGSRLGKNHEDSGFLTKDIVQLKKKIKEKNKSKQIWGVKVPHLIFNLHNLTEEIINPYYIVVVRNPISVAKSQTKRSGSDTATGFRVTSNYYNRIAQFLKGKENVLYLSFEDAISDAHGFVEKLVDFCGLQPSKDMVKNAVDLVDPEKGYQDISYLRSDVKIIKDIPSDKSKVINYEESINDAGVMKKNLLDFRSSYKTMYITMRSRERCCISLTLDVGEGVNPNIVYPLEMERGRNIIELRSRSGIRAVCIREAREYKITEIEAIFSIEVENTK